MDLCSTIKHLQAEAVAGAKADILSENYGHEHKFVVKHRSGGVEFLDVPPPERSIEVGALRSITDLASSHFDVTTQENARQAIFVCGSAVTLIFDTDTGYERAELCLHMSEEWSFFVARAAEPFVSADELRDWIRYRLRGAAPSGFEEKISRIDFTLREQQVQAQSRSGESLGASVIREVTSAQDGKLAMDLPEELQRFTPRLWVNADVRFDAVLECIVDPELRRKGWVIYPQKRSMAEQTQNALDWLAGVIRDQLGDAAAYVPVYCGRWES